MNTAMLREWGVDAVIYVNAVPVPVRGIFSEPRAPYNVGGVPVERADPTFSMLTYDWAETGALPSNTRIDIGARQFTIIKPTPDDGGMIELKLRAYS